MSSFLRSSLIVLAVLAASANVQAAGKARPQTHKTSARVARTKAIAKGRQSARRHAGKAPRQLSRSKMSRHRQRGGHRHRGHHRRGRRVRF
jgi:hypothetical protein